MARNSPELVQNLHAVCNVYARAKMTKTLVSRLAEIQAEEKLEGAFTDVLGFYRKEELSGYRFCLLSADKKLRQDNANEFLSDLFKMYWSDASVLQDKTITEILQ